MSKEYWEMKFTEMTSETILNKGFKYSSDCMLYEHRFKLDEEVSSKIIKICKNDDFALYVFFQTCLQVLLYKIINNNNIITYSAPYGKNGISIDQYLPLQNYISDEMNIKQLLLQNKNILLELYNNQDYDIAPLLSEIWDNKEVLLSEVILAIENIHYTSYRNLENKIMILTSLGKQIEFNVIYNSCTFEDFFVHKVFDYSFNHIINQITDNLNSTIKDIKIISEEEKNLILSNFNSFKYSYQVKTLHELFTLQAKVSPNNIAAQYKNKKITYEELDYMSSYLALKINLYFKDNTIVPIYAKKDLETVIGILGILKAGKAYLPIDSSIPEERLQAILNECNIHQILTLRNNDYKTISTEYNLIYYENLMMDYSEETIKDEELVKLNSSSSSDSLAYIIYTSGTTGKSKGVLIEHQSISNAIAWRKREYNLKQTDNVLVLLSPIFDGYITSLFTPLVSGAKVIIVDEKDMYDLHSLVGVIRNEGVTHFISIPTLYMSILHIATQDDLKSLRMVTLAGEKLTSNIVKLSKEINPDIEIINEYGPTENSVVSTISRNINLNENPSIGHPIDNVDVYIVNQQNEMLPIGVYGEICLSGQGLARGYLNYNEITNAKFIKNPFRPSQKMYLTGDIGRWLPDGKIEYLSRKDNQIKYNGFRIELDGIENVLKGHPLIDDAVVIYFESKKILGAFFTSQSEIDVNEVKNYLKIKLQDAILPNYFEKLESFPLLPNGKVARNKMALNDNNSNIIIGKPTNEIEETIYKIWVNVLGNKNIGINNKFYDIGGNSMLLTQVYEQIDKIYPDKISIMDLFTYPTIYELAIFIQQQNNNRMYKQIELNKIQLPKRFFYESNQNIEEGVEIKISFDNSTLPIMPTLKKIMQKENVSFESILLGINLYLYHKITENKNITIYVIDNNMLKEIAIDFSDLTTLEQLFNISNELLVTCDKCYSLDNTEYHFSSQSQGLVTPLFCIKDSTNLIETLKPFKLIFELNKQKDSFELICKYDEKTLKTSQVKEIVNMYITVMEHIVDSYNEYKNEYSLSKGMTSL